MARLSAGERLMTSIRRVIMGRPVWSVPMHWPMTGGRVPSCGLDYRDRLVLLDELQSPGLSRVERQEERLRAPPALTSALARGRDGLVLETSSTSMSAIASSVQAGTFNAEPPVTLVILP